METLRKGLDKVLEFICCTLLALMTILVTWQVVSRYVLNNPSTITEELVLFSFVWMGLLGGAYLFGKNEHMAMTFLFDKLSEKNQIKVRIFFELVIMAFAVFILIFGGYNMSKLSMGQLSSSLQIPMGYIYLALPLSGITTVIYNILNIYDIINELSIHKNKKGSSIAQ
ncbi:TRAP-type C4-dicarboxylate transport system, small permease component, predicted n-acetylneuraminate transporter [Romboutsia ilealis]|uniref:TRAP-type C4-dicarboxylate transport system, small permease component, predicted n-acetylneuraminate transporter n=1 Tax=Romboutsia ilealis TaxID=1115758 RepID=A0A1V1HZW5_9FIRM|nr:TRAP transporter small permease [Romboutsia ilealis]CED93407.1 TRAP-type C4-dicarboxylate transport system, small permease component, predicted n-acetylneuraminate transporter [Romboutsia ilealis]